MLARKLRRLIQVISALSAGANAVWDDSFSPKMGEEGKNDVLQLALRRGKWCDPTDACVC